MNSGRIRAQFESFRQNLNRARNSLLPLDGDFVRRFNEFIAAYPNVLEWKPGNAETILKALFRYLVHAIDRGYPLATFQDLVIQTPQVLAETEGLEWTLLHQVCRNNPNALDIITFFVQQFPDATKMKSGGRHTPLHFAFLNKAPVPVIRVLFEANPQAAYDCNALGHTPLHSAFSDGVSFDVIQYLVMQAPHICLHRNKYGELPLDQAKHPLFRKDNVVEFMNTITKAAAKVLLKRFCFNGLPHENFEQIMAYLDDGPVSMVKMTIAQGEIAVSFRRNDVREELYAQIQTY